MNLYLRIMRQDERLVSLFDEVMTEFGESPRKLPPDEADGSTDVGMYP